MRFWGAGNDGCIYRSGVTFNDNDGLIFNFYDIQRAKIMNTKPQFKFTPNQLCAIGLCLAAEALLVLVVLRSFGV